MKNYELAAETLNGFGIEAEVVTVPKNNQILTGISVGSGNTRIYVYPPKELKTTDEVVGYVIRVYNEEAKKMNECLKDFSFDKFTLTSRLIHESNEQLLKAFVNRKVSDDLYEVLYLTKTLVDGTASMGFTNEMLLKSEKDVCDLFAKAHQNSFPRARIVDFVKMVQNIQYGNPTDNLLEKDIDIPCQIVTICSMDESYDAIQILNPKVQKRLGELFPKGYYLIPSSIHEWIAIEATFIDSDALAEMICEANSSVVDIQDRLSDHPYKIVNGQLVSA